MKLIKNDFRTVGFFPISTLTTITYTYYSDSPYTLQLIRTHQFYLFWVGRYVFIILTASFERQFEWLF